MRYLFLPEIEMLASRHGFALVEVGGTIRTMNASGALADDASRKRLRVAVVVKNYGIQRSPSILLVLDLLVRCGYQILLILENSGPLPANIQKDIRVLQIPSSRIGKVLALLHLRTYRFDLVLAFDPHAFRLAARFVPLRKIIYYSLELYVGILLTMTIHQTLHHLRDEISMKSAD